MKQVKGTKARRVRNSNVGDPSLDVAPKMTAPQGESGTTDFGGFIGTRETNPALIGVSRYRTFSDFIANIPAVGASVRYILNLVARPTWAFDPADESSEAGRYAELVSTSLLVDLKTPWRRVVRRAATYRFYGFSLQEWWMEKTKKGHLAIYDVRPRPQRTIERWDLDANGAVYAVGQRSVHDSRLKPIPRGKLLYLVDDALDDSPEGMGILRQCAEAVHKLERIGELENIAFENDLRGIPIVKIPYMLLAKMVKAGTITQAERNNIVRPLELIARKHIRVSNMSIAMDSGTYRSEDATGQPSQVPMFGFETLRGESPAALAAQSAIERLVWEIMQLFGCESLLLGKNGKGAFALSKDKTQSILMVIDGIISDLIDQVRLDLILPMFVQNNWDLDLIPQITTNASQYRDLTEISTMVKDMAAAGYMLQPNDKLIPAMRRAANLPLPPDLDMRQMIADAAAAVVGGSVGPGGEILPPKTAAAPIDPAVKSWKQLADMSSEKVLAGFGDRSWSGDDDLEDLGLTVRR